MRAHILHVFRVLMSSILFISQMLLMTFIHRWFRKNSGGVMLMKRHDTVCNVTERSCYLSCHTLSTCEKRSASFGQLQAWFCLNVCWFKGTFLKLPQNMFHFCLWRWVWHCLSNLLDFLPCYFWFCVMVCFCKNKEIPFLTRLHWIDLLHC